MLGIFTHEDVTELFDKRYRICGGGDGEDDGWVMGRRVRHKKLTDSLRSQIPGQEQSVAREVRRFVPDGICPPLAGFSGQYPYSINSAGKRAVPARL